MQNNSEQISRYLLDEMDAAERTSFEMQWKTDPELQEELRIQQAVMKAIENSGIKETFSKAINKKIIQQRLFKWGGLIVAGAAVLILFTYLQKNMSNNGSSEIMAGKPVSDTSLPFVNPPQPSINVPFSEYRFEAEKGETLYHPTGSIIHFPPSSLLDGEGNLVKGPVVILYREFADPLDFFVSGIPMNYDSAGKTYQLESSGMCEILAFQQNKPLYVNPDAKPEINLSGNNPDPLHNLYYLDTAQRNWTYNGKDIITQLTEPFRPAITITIDQADLPVKPIKPGKAADDRQAFSIEVAPGSFEELLAYDKLKFEVIDESNYRRSDADEAWENVQLEHTATEGIYQVTFSNLKRKVSYKVRPVLDGEDYDAALQIFNKKQEAYEQALKKRQEKYKLASDSAAKLTRQLMQQDSVNQTWNEKLNGLITTRNEKLRALKNMNISDLEKAIAIDSITKQDKLFKLSKDEWAIQIDEALYNRVIRSFSINRFGVWNCDKPLISPNNSIPITGKYVDSSGKDISLRMVAVVCPIFNSVGQFPGQWPIQILLGEKNMLWSIRDESFYYFTYNDFDRAGFNWNSKSYVFNMRKADEPIISYEQIKRLVDKM